MQCLHRECGRAARVLHDPEEGGEEAGRRKEPQGLFPWKFRDSLEEERAIREEQHSGQFRKETREGPRLGDLRIRQAIQEHPVSNLQLKDRNMAPGVCQKLGYLRSNLSKDRNHREESMKGGCRLCSFRVRFTHVNL